MTDQSPRINARRLQDYLGRTVRLPCRVINVSGDAAVVEASDGGQIQVRIISGTSLSEAFVEFVGSVQDANTIKMFSCVNMGNDMDMKLVNDTIELTHDAKFATMFFPQ